MGVKESTTRAAEDGSEISSVLKPSELQGRCYGTTAGVNRQHSRPSNGDISQPATTGFFHRDFYCTSLYESNTQHASTELTVGALNMAHAARSVQ